MIFVPFFLLFLVFISAAASSSSRVETYHSDFSFNSKHRGSVSRVGAAPKRTILAKSLREPEDTGIAEDEDTGITEDAEDRSATSSSLGAQFAKDLKGELHNMNRPAVVENRMLVHDGNLHVETSTGQSFQEILSGVIELVERHGGYVASRNEESGKQCGFTCNKRVIMSLRIPSDKFFETIQTIQGMHSENTKTIHLSTNSQDVTDQYVDSSSRAATLAASIRAMQALMEKTNTVEEILTLQQELNSLTQQHEAQKSRAETLKNQAALSTLRLTLEEKVPKEIPLEGDATSQWWTPMGSLTRALGDLGEFCTWIADTLIYCAVLVCIPLCFCLSLLWWCLVPQYRKWQKSRSDSPPLFE